MFFCFTPGTIYEYTILNFGLEQARAYLLGLHECFQILADNPGIGRSPAQFAGESRHHEYQSHIILHIPEEQGAMIVRALHTHMDPTRHFAEPDARGT
jgi:toxin ParE1/3/4